MESLSTNSLSVGVPPLEWPPTWLGHYGNEDHSWTMEALPTGCPFRRGSTAGVASDMMGPRWKRRSFVDDGIPPDKVPCWSRFHRWNGLRHDRATMETKIIRGRWDPSRQGTLPVEVPPLEWPPTLFGPRWKRRSFVDNGIPPDRVPFRSRFHRWNGFRHDRATMETKIIRGRWDPSRQGALPVEVPPLRWLPT